jgi:hypothetical protein
VRNIAEDYAEIEDARQRHPVLHILMARTLIDCAHHGMA